MRELLAVVLVVCAMAACSWHLWLIVVGALVGLVWLGWDATHPEPEQTPRIVSSHPVNAESV